MSTLKQMQSLVSDVKEINKKRDDAIDRYDEAAVDYQIGNTYSFECSLNKESGDTELKLTRRLFQDVIGEITLTNEEAVYGLYKFLRSICEDSEE